MFRSAMRLAQAVPGTRDAVASAPILFVILAALAMMIYPHIR